MSSTTIRELFTAWGFKVDDKALDAVDAKIKKLEATVKYVGGTAIAGAAAIFGLATAAGDAGAEVGHAAERIGIGVEALQEYQYAARVAGQSNEGFQGSLQTLVKNLFDARRGLGSSREAFYLLGNALGKDLLAKGKSAEEILNDVADGLNLVTDKSRKLELASQLFGGDAGGMLTTLRGGSAGLAALRGEARATGVVMGENAVKAAEAYKASMERLKSTLLGVRNTLGVSLFPLVERVAGAFTRWIVVNRRWLTSGLHEGLQTLSTLVSRVVFIAERLGAVLNTTAIAFGGWNRVLKVVTAAMVTILAMRIASFFGSLILVVVRAAAAMTLLGNAGLLAQLKLAAIPLAIGAAFIALLLIIEDVVAYFQGRKSITGLILNNFDGLDKGLDRFIDPILAKVTGFGKRIGKAIVEGMEKLNDADWGKVGEFVLHSLELLLKVSEIPIKIGFAIAGGIMDGLVEGLRKKFPKLATLLGLDEGGGGTKLGGESPLGANGDKLFGVSAADALRGLHGAISGAGDIAGPPSPGGAASTYSNKSVVFNVDVKQTTNVPAGTSGKDIAPITTQSIKDSLAPIIQETHAATAAAGPY